MSEPNASEQYLASASSRAAAKWLIVSTLVAAAGTFGSVILSVGMGLKACPLCFYQRSFVMAALAALLLGGALERSRAGLICLLNIPMVFAGLGVAAFHEYLVLTDVLECPQAILGIGTAPAQSLAMFIVLAVTTSRGAWSGRGESPKQGMSTLISTMFLGVVMAATCIKSSPPLPKMPTEAYDPVKEPLDTCRRPFVAPSN